MSNIDFVIDNLYNKMNIEESKYYISVSPIVDIYVNGDSGYILHENGYCEQWGRYTVPGTIEFIKEFKDTDYNLHTQMLFHNYAADIYSRPNYYWINGMSVYNLTTTGFTAGTFNNEETYYPNHYLRCWRACGYVEVEE